MTSIIKIFFGLTFILTMSFAQVNYWNPSNGPYGSYAFSIAANPNGHIFLASSRGIYRSTNKGQDWFLLPNSPIGIIQSILCSPDSTIYAAFISEYGSGVYISKNDGNTWNSTGLNAEFVKCLGITTSGTLFAGTQDGLFRLVNGGNAWSLVLPSKLVYCIATKGDIVFTDMAEGLFRSTNDGVTWSQIKDSIFNLPVSAIGIDNRGNVIESGWGTYVSKDNGDSWNKLTDFSGNCLASDSLGNIYMGSFYNMYISKDYGTSWSIADSGMPQIQVNAITCDQENNVFATRYEEGVFCSTNNGTTWKRKNNGLRDIYISSILIPSNGSIFVASTSGIFTSMDNGNQWNQILPAKYYSSVSTLAKNRDGYLFAGGFELGIYSSSDGGTTWQNSASSYYNVSSFVADSKNNMYAMTNQTGVIVSSDNGNSWRHIGLDSIYLTSAALSVNGNIYIGTDNKGIFTIAPNSNISQTCQAFGFVQCMACNSKGTLFAGTESSGIFRSTNQGISWENIDNNSPARCIYSIIISADDRIFASTFNYGVITSSDGGANWKQLISGLEGNEYYSIALSPDGYLFLGSNFGLFQSDSSIINPYSNINVDIPYLAQNYPNPFNSMSTVRFYLPHEKIVSKKLYDILGREIKTLVNSLFTSGWHSIKMNSEGIASGIYFYKMQSENYSITKKLVLLK